MSLNIVHARLEGVARFAALVGGLGIIVIAVMVTMDVLLRKFFNTTLGGATEMSGFIFAIGTALSYPYVLFDRANIRIDVVYSLVSSRIRAGLDLLALLLLLYFVSMLTLSVAGVFVKSWEGNSMSIGVVNVRLWIPQLFWMIGYVLFSATALLLTVFAVAALVRRDYATVNRVAGVPSVEETIEEETYITPDHPAESTRPEDEEKH
ncbi:TRAP transporter small permease subunit [Antarctobacter sp.]|uniref:TRAP transporter small permease subunit n=1 Tax=Antarctobacter sp. TaxID=1872577 RepID=UPI003A944E50